MEYSSDRLSPRAVYVHVPFCARKCEYCAFYSTAGDASLIARYVAALVREFELRRSDLARPLESLFFGGGTPSLLSMEHWRTLLRALEDVPRREDCEWTVECNPATISVDKARLLREGGVNRVSLGVQSLDEDLLDRLGRVHSRDMVFRSFDALRAAGFERINLDLMFGIPGQTMITWKETLREALALGSEHVSCYEVIYEEDTPLFEQMKAGEFDVDEDLASAMFEELVEAAGAAGYRQYEVANFARDRRVSETAMSRESSEASDEIPRFACRHNVNYWRGGAYAAFGPSASGYEDGVRYRNVSNTPRYCEALERDERPVESRDTLAPLARAGEIAAFGLRMNAGWPWEAFRTATGFDLREGWAEEMDRLVAKGWGCREPDRFRLTATGLRFADAAGSEFLRPDGR